MTDLHEVQAQLEESMSSRGVERFLRNLANSVERGEEDNTFYGKKLAGTYVSSVAAAIATWSDDMAKGFARSRTETYGYLKGMNPNVLAIIALRTVLSTLSKPRTRTSIVSDIGMSVEDEARYAKYEQEMGRRKAMWLDEGIRSRSSDHYRRYYAKHKIESEIEWVDWPRNLRLSVGQLLLDITMQVTGLFQVEDKRQRSGKGVNQIHIITATPALMQWVERSTATAMLTQPMYEPMVVRPLDWDVGVMGGYLTNCLRPIPLVRHIASGLREEMRELEMPVVYDALNRVQSTAWRVNKRVAEVMANLYASGAHIDCIPSTDLPVPMRPAEADTDEEVNRAWKDKAQAVHRLNSTSRGKRLAFAAALDTAQRYADYDAIYFPHNVDFRGRVYPVTQLSPQGSDNVKALLTFSEGLALGDQGITWLAIHGANLAGVDKVAYQDRVTWVEENTDKILAVAADPYENRWWTEQDSPWQFLAFCFEWAGVCEQGEAFVSHLPVAMDGSCSGLQHFSAMLRDPIGGAAVNLVPQEKPADVYARVAEVVNAKLAEHVASGNADEKRLAAEWQAFGVTRSVCKRPVMTLAYGAKQYGFGEQIMEDTIQPAIDKSFATYGAVMLDVAPWTEPMRSANYLAKLVWEAVNEVLVAASQAMAWLQTVAGVVAKSGRPVTWSTPTGFLVQQDYRDRRPVRVKVKSLGKTHLLTVQEEQLSIDARKQASSIAPNFVHSFDATHLMLTIARGGEAGIESFAVIHDSFGTHAANADKLFRVVRSAMVELYSDFDVLEQFREEALHQVGEELADEIPPCPSKGTLDLNEINNSLYCFA